MKKLLLLLFSLMISFESYGEWTEIPVINDDFAEQAFIDFDNLKKKKDGYVYWWMMTSRSDSSEKIYLQSDCDGERFYPLSAVLHTKPLGKGESTSISPNEGWTYPAPDTVMYNFLEVICEIADEVPEQRDKSVENLLMSLEYKKKINDLYEIEMELEDDFPTVISIDENLNYYISPKDESIPEAISYNELINAASDRMMSNPEMKVWINADKKIDYGKVLEVVTPLKKFNNPIGFLTEAEFITELTQSEWVRTVAEKVKSNWRYQGAEDDWQAEVYVVQDRDGTIVAVDVRNSNIGDSQKAKVFQDSIRRAVYKSSPLPRMDDAYYSNEFIFIFSVN